MSVCEAVSRMRVRGLGLVPSCECGCGCARVHDSAVRLWGRAGRGCARGRYVCAEALRLCVWAGGVR